MLERMQPKPPPSRIKVGTLRVAFCIVRPGLGLSPDVSHLCGEHPRLSCFPHNLLRSVLKTDSSSILENNCLVFLSKNHGDDDKGC